MRTKDVARLTPCKHCPYRKDVRPYLTPARVQELASCAEKGTTFLCHKTTRSTGDGSEKHCAGKLVLARKLDRLYHDQLVRIQDRLGVDFDEVKDPGDLVYGSVAEMVEACREAN